MSWEQDNVPIDHDIPNESLYNPFQSNMFDDYADYDDDYPINKTIESCREEFQNQTEYLQAHHPNGFCNVTFDSIMCWPPTPYNETATIKCFKYLFSITYDESQDATRFCDGIKQNWAKQNYSMCTELINIPDNNATQTLLYFLGFTLSIITLIVAVTIFLYFKDLHCLRNKIHVNLMFSYIIMYSTWIVMLILINYRDNSIILCGFGTTLLHYSHVSTFFWMFVEGMYLYILVVKTLRREIFKLRVYVSIGWGIPLLFIVVWAVVKRFVSVDKNCPWLYDDSIDWIYLAPPLLVVTLNVAFLFSIMWVLITKLRSSPSPAVIEHQHHQKAARALLILIPLLGITWIVTIYVPSADNWQKVFESLRSILLSTQGLAIALCYCFLNTEVQNTIKHHYENWKTRRSLGKNSGMNNHRRHTEWTLVSASELEASTSLSNHNHNHNLNNSHNSNDNQVPDNPGP